MENLTEDDKGAGEWRQRLRRVGEDDRVKRLEEDVRVDIVLVLEAIAEGEEAAERENRRCFRVRQRLGVQTESPLKRALCRGGTAKAEWLNRNYEGL